MQRPLLTFLITASLVVPLVGEETTSQLLNPSFEDSADDAGFPDGWKVAPDAEVALTDKDVSHGQRALVLTEGYAAVSQNLDVTGLAGKIITLQVDARSPDQGALGVRLGYFIQDDSGKHWVDAPMLWNKLLAPEFQSLTATRAVPETALDGRVWFCIYRSRNEGTVVVDNVLLEFSQ